MKMKNIFGILLFMAGVQMAWPQSMKIWHNGKNVGFDVRSVDSVEFVASNLVLGISFSQDQMEIMKGARRKLTAILSPADADSPILWESNKPDVASVDGNGMVTAQSVGIAIISAKTADERGISASCAVSVYMAANGTDYVDLGFPSRTLWATRNVGAYSPEESGDFFAWGETSTKEKYDWETYQYCKGQPNTLTKYCVDSEYGYNGFTDGLTELLPEDDAATANWGDEWQTPNVAQLQELYNSDYTTTEWTTQDGVYGRKITSKSNGNSIFLPAAGCCSGTELRNVGSEGHYWSCELMSGDSNRGSNLGFTSRVPYGILVYYQFGYGWEYPRLYGMPVRAVRRR